MRIFAISFLAIIVASALGYFYWNEQRASVESPLLYCTENTDLIIISSSPADFQSILHDTNSIFTVEKSLEELAEKLAEIMESIEQVNDSVLVAYSTKTGEFRTLLKSTDETRSIGVASSTDNWRIISNREPTISPSSNPINQELQSALKSVSTPVGFAIKGDVIRGEISESIHPIFQELLFSGFTEASWLGFDLTNEYPFTASSIYRAKVNRSDCQRVSDLLIQLPVKTNTFYGKCVEDDLIGLAHIPYVKMPEMIDENLFIIVKPSTIDSVKFPLSTPTKVNSEDLPFELKSWITETSVAMNLGDQVVFAHNSSQLGRYYNDYKSFNFLAKSEWYQNLRASISDGSWCFFANRLTEFEVPNGLSRPDSSLIGSILIQSNSELIGNQFLTLTALYNETSQPVLPELWHIQFDDKLIGGPWPFENHYTGEAEFLVQDESGSLYLVNNEGKTLWKKRMDEPIIDRVKSVDVYGSKKLQLLFCTRDKLHLLDRNGKYVEGFPIKLENETNVAPTSIRYSRDGDIRILFADGTALKNVQSDGLPVKGWKNPKLGSIARSEIQYLKFQNKDYFVVLNQKSELEIFDRTGLEKSEPIQFPEGAKYVGLRAGSELKSSILIGYDTAGNLFHKQFDGTLNKFNILPVGNGVKMLHRSGNKAVYLTYNDNRVFGLDNGQDVVFDLLLPSDDIAEMQFLSDRVLALLDEGKAVLYYVDIEQGTLLRQSMSGDLRSRIMDLNGDGVDEYLHHNGDGRLTAYPNL